MGNRILVTGASGLVGRELVKRLLDSGRPVTAFIRDRRKLEDLSHHIRLLKVVEGSFDSQEDLREAFEDVYQIAHLAGTLIESLQDTYDKVNYLWTINLVKIAKEREISKFIYLSYPGVSPNARNAYLRSKWFAEYEIAYSGLNFTIYRCSWFYGKGSKFLDAIVKSLEPRRVVIIGRGDQKLAPIRVDDVVDLILISLRDSLTDRRIFEAGGEIVSLKEFVQLIARVLGRRDEIKWVNGLPSAMVLAYFQKYFVRHPTVSPELFALLSRDSIPNMIEFKKVIDFEFTPLEEGLQKSLIE